MGGTGPCLIVQTGDMRAAMQGFAAGAAETYLEQRRSVAFVAEAARAQPIVVVYPSLAPHDESGGPGLRLIGVTAEQFWARDFGRALGARLRPGSASVRLPLGPAIAALCARGIPVFPCFADLFRPVPPSALLSRAGLSRLRFNLRLRRVLRHPGVVAVGNHSLGASQSVRRVLGVAPERVLPWEYSRMEVEPGPLPTRAAGPLALVYAGALLRSKGVGDLIQALAALRAAGMAARLRIFGAGADRPALEAMVAAADLGPAVRFEGLAPNLDVRAAMRAADAVVVPSWHAYAEGLPNVITEALSVRCPLVLTDHPAYAARFAAGRDCLIVPERAPEALAVALLRLAREPGLAEALRHRSGAVLAGLHVGTSWYAVMEQFLADPADSTGWVLPRSLARLAPASG